MEADIDKIKPFIYELEYHFGATVLFQVPDPDFEMESFG